MDRLSTKAAIDVRVTLFSDLRKYLPKEQRGPQRRRLAAGSRVRDLVASLGIPEDADITVGVNDELASLDSPLSDGDDVTMFSPMEGG